MDSEAIGAVRELFAEIDAAVPRDQESQAEHARRLFGLLEREGGIVEAVDEPAFHRTRLAELGTWTDDPWDGATYGVDASTTRPLEYNNGLVVDAAHAKTGVTGGDTDRTLERSGRVVGVAYLDDSDSTLHEKTLEGEYVTADLVRFPEATEEPRNISKSVAAVAQRLSESRQAVESLDALEGALFLDGSVLPLGIVYWVLLDHAGGRSPAGSWNLPAEIVGNYIEIIDHQYKREQPVLGIVKTSSMSQVLDALREKIDQHNIRGDHGRLLDVPWVRDHQFMAEVLRFDDLEYLTYTSWFVSSGQEINGQRYELLEPLADRLGHGSPSDYRRAFCFVRLPKTGDLLRVEAPYLMVRDDEMRERVQLKALKEIAQQQGVPRSIERADKLARISRENRRKIRGLIERTEASYDHNWDGRWRDLDDDTDL
ncbi:DNA double-strand break repair nuclease NurA [Haloferax denitrificans]|uniref:DNA double-strand break repair nuclease NurA n=1 Tax=Haloferax denitrificans TaxID=35745 RepID=UPI003C6FBD19